MHLKTSLDPDTITKPGGNIGAGNDGIVFQSFQKENSQKQHKNILNETKNKNTIFSLKCHIVYIS